MLWMDAEPSVCMAGPSRLTITGGRPTCARSRLFEETTTSAGRHPVGRIVGLCIGAATISRDEDTSIEGRLNVP